MDVQTQVPEAVKKQGERADELHRQMYPDQYPKEPGGEQTEKGKENPEGAATPEEKKPEQPKPAETKVEPGKEAGKEAVGEDWKQKYETLQGKYNAEVPSLHTTVAALRNQLQEALGQIEVLKTEKAKPVEEKKEPPKPEEEELSDPALKGFKEEYPDIYDAVKKMVTVKSKVKEPPKEEKPKEEKPKEEKPKEEKPPASVSSSRATFDYYLNRDVPDWRTVNKDPEFIAFLGNPDPNFPGMTKLQSIQAAYDAADFPTVIGHFRDFKASKKAPAVNPQASEKPPEDQAKERELTPEEKQLAPPKGGRAPAGDSTPTVTTADLTKFYDEARRGLWGPITEERFRKEEARLLAALTKKT